MLYFLQYESNLAENIYNFVVTTVPADGLAPLGARASAGTVMINFRSRLYRSINTWRVNEPVQKRFNPSVYTI